MRLNTCEVPKEECDTIPLHNPWTGPDVQGRYLITCAWGPAWIDDCPLGCGSRHVRKVCQKSK